MKVLHIAESVVGGIATYLNELVPLQQREFGIDSVRLLIPEQDVIELKDIPQRTVAVFNRKGRWLSLSNFSYGAIRAISDFRPDVIHAHSTFAGAILRVMSIFWYRMPPIIYCPHGWAFDMAVPRIVRRIISAVERILAPRAKIIIAISRHEQRRACEIGIDPNMVVLVENGISIDAPEGTSVEWIDDRLKLLFVGRLDRQKGLDVLIDAVQSLPQLVCLRVIGREVVGSKWNRLIASNVKYLGWMDRASVTSYMSACDIVVVPSRWEGFGLVAIEAMRSSKPVIASKAGGLPFVVVEGETGWLFPVEDVEALRAVLVSVHRDELSKIGEAGRRQFLSNFTAVRMHHLIADVYCNVVR